MRSRPIVLKDQSEMIVWRGGGDVYGMVVSCLREGSIENSFI